MHTLTQNERHIADVEALLSRHGFPEQTGKSGFHDRFDSGRGCLRFTGVSVKTHLGGALELFSSIPQLSIQVFEELGCDS